MEEINIDLPKRSSPKISECCQQVFPMFIVYGTETVLTEAEIKRPHAAQLSSTGTRSKWPPNSISVLRCQIMGCCGLSSPDSTGPLSADREACYCANCSFGELDHCWRIHSNLCLSSTLTDHNQLAFPNIICQTKFKITSHIRSNLFTHFYPSKKTDGTQNCQQKCIFNHLIHQKEYYHTYIYTAAPE